MDFLKQIWDSSVANVANIFVYILIVFLFILGLVTCIAPVLRNRNVLARAIRNIKAKQKARYSWQEDGFLGRGPLMAHWTAYLNNLFFADGEYHNASNVEDFINEETVIYGPGRSAFADALPTLLVSLGFLGTLIGLAQGLSGFDMTDSAAAQNSIMTLIPGMKYAFMTSIFGVIGSVLFTLITRAVSGSTEHRLRSFYGAMSRYAGVHSVDPLTQVAIYQQEQTALIQTISRDISTGFSEKLTGAIREALEPFNESIHGFMTVTSQEQMRFLDAVVMRFVDRMNEVLSGQLRGFSRTLEEVNRTQQTAFESLRSALSESQAAVRDIRDLQLVSAEMVSNMNGYLATVRQTAKEAEGGFARVSAAVDRMGEIAERQSAYLATVRNMQKDISASADSLAASGESLRAIHQEAVRALREEMDATMDSYRDYVNQFTQRIDYMAESISDSLSTMPQSVRETSDRFLDEMRELTKTLAKAQRALDDAVESLYGDRRR